MTASAANPIPHEVTVKKENAETITSNTDETRPSKISKSYSFYTSAKGLGSSSSSTPIKRPSPDSASFTPSKVPCNQAVYNSTVCNSAVCNPAVCNPAVSNPVVSNPVVSNPSMNININIPMAMAMGNPQMQGIYNPQLKGSYNPQLNGSYNPQPNGSHNPQLNGYYNPQLNGYYNPQLNGYYNPQLNGYYNPQLNGTYNPQLNGVCCPPINGMYNPKSISAPMNMPYNPQMYSNATPQIYSNATPQMYSNVVPPTYSNAAPPIYSNVAPPIYSNVAPPINHLPTQGGPNTIPQGNQNAIPQESQIVIPQGNKNFNSTSSQPIIPPKGKSNKSPVGPAPNSQTTQQILSPTPGIFPAVHPKTQKAANPASTPSKLGNDDDSKKQNTFKSLFEKLAEMPARDDTEFDPLSMLPGKSKKSVDPMSLLYSKGIQKAFLEGSHKFEKCVSGCTPLDDEINMSGNETLKKIYEINYTDKSGALRKVSKLTMIALRDDMLWKLVVAATTQPIFEHYFPQIAKDFHLFSKANKKILDFLKTHIKDEDLIKSKNGDEYDLPGFISQMADKVHSMDRMWRSEAGEQNHVISLMVRQWKGESQVGLDVITKMIQDFKRKYEDKPESYDPEIHLMTIFDKFPDEETEAIQTWFNKTLAKDPTLTQEQLVRQFMRERRLILSKVEPLEQKFSVQATRDIYEKYMEVLKEHDCENEFWKLKVASVKKAKDLDPAHRKRSHRGKWLDRSSDSESGFGMGFDSGSDLDCPSG